MSISLYLISKTLEHSCPRMEGASLSFSFISSNLEALQLLKYIERKVLAAQDAAASNNMKGAGSQLGPAWSCSWAYSDAFVLELVVQLWSSSLLQEGEVVLLLVIHPGRCVWLYCKHCS